MKSQSRLLVAFLEPDLPCFSLLTTAKSESKDTVIQTRAATTSQQSEADILSESGGNTRLQGTQVKAGTFTVNAGVGPKADPNAKIINLTDDDLRKLAAENPEVLNQLIAGIGKTDAPIVVKDSSAQNMTGSSIQDLRNPNDRTAIAKESDMGYVNINGQARVFVQTGMDNTRQDAGVSAQALSKTFGGVNTGYINNGTEGLTGDVGEYLPNSLSKKDVLNEYTYRTLNAQGQTLIVTHSAGNEDARKALQAGVMYGHSYDNLSFVSLGSPVSNSVMRQSVTNAGANYLGQVNDWRDPVTYSKTAAVVGGGGFLTGGALFVTGIFTANPALLYAGGSMAAGAAGAAGAGIQYVHPFPQYIAKPQSQSIMFDWLKNNLQVK